MKIKTHRSRQACERSDPDLRDAISSKPAVLQELHASGRLQFISESTIAWKATTVFEPTYTYAQECVRHARQALEAFSPGSARCISVLARFTPPLPVFFF